MIKYKGKAKCGFCGPEPSRARYRSCDRFACGDCKERIKNDPDPEVENDRITEADRQTWMKL